MRGFARAAGRRLACFVRPRPPHGAPTIRATALQKHLRADRDNIGKTYDFDLTKLQVGLDI
jgi:hypothetical protein